MPKPSAGLPAMETLEPRFLLSGAMIVTSEALAEAFGDVAQWYTRKGYAAEVVTVESIDAEYAGADRPERIRNGIRDRHENNDVLYVLLGGDDTVVPARQAAAGDDGGVPSDLYYSSLTGRWDADGDGTFGEADGDNVSFDYDTIVARYPVRTAEQVRTLLAKVIAYETAPPQADWAADMLAVGNELWNPGDAEKKSITADADYVQGHWPQRDLDVFFDTRTSWDLAAPGDHLLDAQNLLAAMGNGYQFMHVAAHGTPSGWALESGRLTGQAVSAPPGAVNVAVVSTIACDTGAFDLGEPSLSEAFLRSDATGTIVYLGAVRNGWGIPGHWLGPSFQYSYTFTREFLTGPTQIAGEVFAETKASFAPKSTHEGATRWLQFGLNFQGDPLVQMYRDDPAALEPTFDARVTEGRQTYEVASVPAGARVVLWQAGEVYEVGLADESGSFSAEVSPSTGAMALTVIAPDAAVFTDEVAVVRPAGVPAQGAQGPAGGAEGPAGPQQQGAGGDEPAPRIGAVVPGNTAALATAFAWLDAGETPAAPTVRTDLAPVAAVDGPDVEGRLDPLAAEQPLGDAPVPEPAAPPATSGPSVVDGPDVDDETDPAAGASDGVLVTADTMPVVDLTSGWDLTEAADDLAA